MASLTFEMANGDIKDFKLPYMDNGSLEWELNSVPDFFGTDKQKKSREGNSLYPGFELFMATTTFDAYRPLGAEKVLVLRWYRFNRAMVDNIDALMGFARENDLLDYGIVWDGTYSTGGSRGVYALRRLQSKLFKMTFGNLRISDISAEAATRLKRYANSLSASPPAREEFDPGGYLLDWVENELEPAISTGKKYTEVVPFKSYYLPRGSDGFVTPDPVHFKGPFTILLSPYGCSHLDQFAAMVIDNHLGYSVGMPTGGCSNTWEWEEDLAFSDGTPVARFMWSIGQTIRPNGEVLEGNPAMVEDYIPLTIENFKAYQELLLKKALERQN